MKPIFEAKVIFAMLFALSVRLPEKLRVCVIAVPAVTVRAILPLL